MFCLNWSNPNYSYSKSYPLQNSSSLILIPFSLDFKAFHECLGRFFIFILGGFSNLKQITYFLFQFMYFEYLGTSICHRYSPKKKKEKNTMAWMITMHIYGSDFKIYFLFLFLVLLTTYRSSWARDQTCSIVVAAVTMPGPLTTRPSRNSLDFFKLNLSSVLFFLQTFFQVPPPMSCNILHQKNRPS